MVITTHKQFDKAYVRLPDKIKQQFKERRDLFLQDPHHPTLRNHTLVGKYIGYRSINITGDYRVIYKHINEQTVVFARIGTHNQLY